jgi:ribonuclease Y
MSTGVTDLAVILALAVVVVVLALVVWLVVQHRRERAGQQPLQPAAKGDGPTSLTASPADVEAMTSLAVERSAAAEQALSAAQALLAEQALAAERNAARAESLAATEVELSTAREQVLGQRLELDLREQRVVDREERVEADRTAQRHEAERLDAAMSMADRRAAELDERTVQLAEREIALAGLEQERLIALEKAAGLSAEAARAEIVAAVETQAKRSAAAHVRAIEKDAEREADARARRIVTAAVQRVASEQTAEAVVTVLHLPSDDMKGRIIGREGRNIRAFEALTGVNLIIDDTPEAVVLSCFDPVRREIGRLTLQSLVLDGRIHPHRIEEVFERSKGEIDEVCQRAAEDALVEVGITDVHPEIVGLLGRLRFRTSYGQNVLRHLVETAHVGGLLAAELGMDVPLVKRCAFLHDIGKALTHEAEGSHAIVGAEVARRCGESEAVAHAIEAHHNEVEVRTMEAVLTQAADAVSGGRPGARRESLESYVTRLRRLEEIAVAHEGVDKVYAMQAGHEVRVMVVPDEVDDIGAQVLARDIAKQVEEELTYPGQIKVTVVRESRATEVAR